MNKLCLPLLSLALIISTSCSRGPEGTQGGDCADGADNDGNGLIDCEDNGCNADTFCADQAQKAKEAEEAANRARREAEEAAKKKAEEESALPYLVMGELWVQRGHNGENVSFNGASEFCQRLKLADKEDWRLPTKSEAVMIAKSGKVAPEAYVMWTSTLLSKKRGIIVGITSGAANELGVPYDGDCRARCVRDQ